MNAAAPTILGMPHRRSATIIASHARRTATALLCALAFGCEESATYSNAVPAPSAAPAATPKAAAAQDQPAAGGAPADGPARRQSSSVLGKARDSALNVRDQVEARDREIQKQIDEKP